MAATAIRRAIWAGFVTIFGGAADRPSLPTTPQVPSPVLQSVVDKKLPRYAMSDVNVPTVSTVSPALPARLDMMPTTHRPVAAGASQNPLGVPYSSVIPGSPIKKWLLYCPTSGKTLPCFQAHPYVGPITGVYSCDENAATGGYDCRNCPTNVTSLLPQAKQPAMSQTDSSMLPRTNTQVLTAAPAQAAKAGYVSDRNTLPFNTLGRFRFTGRDHLYPAHYTPPGRGFWNTPINQPETAVSR